MQQSDMLGICEEDMMCWHHVAAVFERFAQCLPTSMRDECLLLSAVCRERSEIHIRAIERLRQSRSDESLLPE